MRDLMPYQNPTTAPIQTPPRPPAPRRRPRRRAGAGLVLVTIGVLTLVAAFIGSPLAGEFFLPALGLVFLVWGLTARHIVPVVPGGILLGIGAGNILARQLYGGTSGHDASAVMLIALGGGFLIITPLSRLATPRWQLWPLVPGVILAAVGAAILIGGFAPQVVSFAGLVWPLVLIALGAYLVLQAGRRPRKPSR